MIKDQGMDVDKSDCELSITKQLSLISFDKKNGREGFSDCKDFHKNELCKKRCDSTGSVKSCTDQLRFIQKTVRDTSCDATSSHDTSSNPEQSLPSPGNIDSKRHTLQKVPSITVCDDTENRAGVESRKNSLFDPRFLMPTESSVDEARYLLASRRVSLPSTSKGIRSRSLDMVAEEQPSDSAHESNTSVPLASLGLPRYRARSRSLDTGLRKRNNFSAFKESLKLRDVQKNKAWYVRRDLSLAKEVTASYLDLCYPFCSLLRMSWWSNLCYAKARTRTQQSTTFFLLGGSIFPT